jgi:hypothetical protein
MHRFGSPSFGLQWVKVVFTVAALSLASPAWAQRPDARQLVASADALRQVYPDAVMQVRLNHLSEASVQKDSLLRVAVRGSEASLIRVLQGPDQGQQLLMLDEGLWVKLPRSARTVRITPMQRVLGDASVGDIGRLRWQDDYEARYADPPETVLDGVPAWRLELAARREGATAYSRIVATVAKQDSRPLHAEFFLKSGKPIKAVIYGPVEPINDRSGIRRMEFRDLVKSGSRTLLVVEKVEPKAIDPQYFSLERLGSWQ